jgi:spermidine synthase
LLRAAVLALTVLTGFSGLVYEVAWQRYLATLLGSHSEATAAVLGLFLGGLSLGYSLFGRVTRWRLGRAAARGVAPRLLLLYGCVEASIGLHALAFPWLFGGVRALSFAIPHAPGGPGFALDVALAALLILPPCVLMGGTIPILTQALARSLADATRIHAFVYAFNTAGAFLGALAAALVLIPWLGLERVVWAMGAVNLAAGTTLGALGLRRREVFAAGGESASPPPVGIYAAAALLVGFAAMTLEIVLIRLGGLSLGSSQFTFAMVVAVFVLCIALGSFAVSALPRIGPRTLVAAQWSLVALLLILYPWLPDAPWAAHVLRSWFRDNEHAFYPYHLTVFASALALLALPVGLSGATLPLIFHHLRRQVGDLGAAAGRLYAWNTVGSLLGALLGGYLLFFWLDLDQVYRVALGAVVASALLLTVHLFELPRAATLAFVLVPALAGVALLEPWEPMRLSSGAFRRREPTPVSYEGPARFYHSESNVVFYDDDPNSSVAVWETAMNDGKKDVAIITNGKPDGSIHFDYPTMGLAALVPGLFAERAESAFVIGFGTGVTVGELAALRSMQRVVVAEISPAVITAGRWFETRNQGALRSPKTRIVISDAYRALLRSPDQYDVIASEPSNPWVTGVEMLYSREFLEAARGRLRPGGVYCQWFHTYENDSAVVQLVLRTYASVFDHVAVWYAMGPDLLLLGFRDPDHAVDLRRLRARVAEPEMTAALRRAGVTSLPALLAHELLPLDVVNAAGLEGDVQTLLQPVLSFRAGRAFFVGRNAALPATTQPAPAAAGANHSLLGRLSAESGGTLSDEVHHQLAAEACKHLATVCATFLARWMHEHPESEAREALLATARTKPGFATHLAPQQLATLTGLFGAGLAENGAATPETARRVTDLFVRYYHHGAPFSREVLAALWRRCDDAKGERCSQGRAAAEARVGPLRSAAETSRADVSG